MYSVSMSPADEQSITHHVKICVTILHCDWPHGTCSFTRSPDQAGTGRSVYQLVAVASHVCRFVTPQICNESLDGGCLLQV